MGNTLKDRIVELCESGSKIAAIKLYREEMGGGLWCGLLQAKYAVDNIWYRHCEEQQRFWTMRFNEAARTVSFHNR